MTRKCALIVDDSKTARQVLAKKLQAYEIEVETADSAANAIDFLHGNTPDAVFMDYEMPGMDGFQALKIIKSNPRTATIPVMMYTSKAGGIALSQARALGAIGVLPKQMEAHGLEAIIEQLHLHPHQRSLVEKFHDGNDQYQPKVTYTSGNDSSSNVEYINRQRVGVEKVEYPEEVYDESVFLLKRQTRIYLKELMSVEKRILDSLTKEVRLFREDLHAANNLQEKMKNQPKGKGGLLYLLNLLLLLMVGYLTWQHSLLNVESPPSGRMGVIESKLYDIKTQVGDIVASMQDSNSTSSARGSEEVDSDRDQVAIQHSIGFLDWAANRGTEFGYGENPYDDVRVAWLSDLVNQLNKAGFRGSINLKAHYGNFCLSKSETGALILARDDVRFEDCLFSVDSTETGFAQSSYQTLGFANYLNSILSEEDIPIEVFVETDSFDEPVLPYPQGYSAKTAGEWNRVAAQNQRILVTLYQKMEM